jgi:hypothetical protein
MSSPELDLVDVARDGRWCQVTLMDASSAADTANRLEGLFAAVISADLGPESAGILAALRPGLQEIVCFDSLVEPVVAGQEFAMNALEELGFGQDFVFTVPKLEDAVDYAVDRLLAPDHGGWEGRFVVVVGPRPVIDRAHQHLTEPGQSPEDRIRG